MRRISYWIKELRNQTATGFTSSVPKQLRNKAVGTKTNQHSVEEITPEVKPNTSKLRVSTHRMNRNPTGNGRPLVIIIKSYRLKSQLKKIKPVCLQSILSIFSSVSSHVLSHTHHETRAHAFVDIVKTASPRECHKAIHACMPYKNTLRGKVK